MRLRKRLVAATCGTALAAAVVAVGHTMVTPATAAQPPAADPVAAGVAEALGISAEQATRELAAQDGAHRLYK